VPVESFVVTYILYHPMRDGGKLFRIPSHPVQRSYETMRAYRYEGKSAVEVGKMFGYTPRSVGALALKLRRRVQRHVSRTSDTEGSTVRSQYS
jgi:hypothetical protein